MTVYVFFHNAQIRNSGGMRVIFNVADIIKSMGYDTKVMLPGVGLYPDENPAGWRPDWFHTDVEVVNDPGMITSDDLVIIHEEGIWAHEFLLANRPRYIMFNQGAQASLTNWMSAPTLKQIYHESQGVFVVSKYIESFVHRCIGIPREKIYNVGNRVSPLHGSVSLHKDNNILVLCKNKEISYRLIIEMVKADNPHWNVEIVENYDELQLAHAMQRSKMFLFFCGSYGEGLGLPPIEAAINGCKVIGYSGMGGKEYYDDYGDLFTEIETNDVVGFIEETNKWARLLENNDLDNLINLDYTRQRLIHNYSMDKFISNIEDAFRKVING